MSNYEKIAKESRLKVLELVFLAQTSHIGSLLGCADIFAVLFEKIDLEKDKFVLGKSWAAALLYFHLWRKGKITLEQLDSYCIGDSPFIGLAEPIAGLEQFFPFGIGSMGMGFPAAVGLALSKKLKGEKGTVYCLISDGEMNCGTTHEAALIAAHHELDNLMVIIDKNLMQAMGSTSDILNIRKFDDLWESWGWSVGECDGHDFELMSVYFNDRDSGVPLVVIADTMKGKGWKRAENNNLYHYKQLSQEEYEEAKKEIWEK
ncbi:MAG: 1-deoxy-D-xylulose-5-phosphate synthase N-terminal domain-containing protein [Minisyncoccia bacterium]